MEPDSIGKSFALDIAAFADKIVDLVAMADGRHSLSDDRTGIKFRRHVMRCCTDEFHAALMGAVVRLCTRECRQK